MPYTKQEISSLLQFSDLWQIACSDFLGDIDNHYPSHRLFDFLKRTPVIHRRVVQDSPVQGPTIFTDASGNGKAGYWSEPDHKIKTHSFPSVQQGELFAILLVVQNFLDTPSMLSLLSVA